MAINKLMKSVNAGAAPRTVETNFHAISSRMEQLMEQHAKYLAVKHPGDSEPTKEETEWVQEVEEQYEEVEQTYTRYMNTVTEQGLSGHEVKKITRVYHFEIETAEVMLTSLKMITRDKSATTTCRAALRDLFTEGDDDLVEKLAASMKGLQLE